MDLFSVNIAYADFNSFMGNVNSMIVNPIINLLFALAVIYFLYGIFEFFLNGDNEEKRTASKNHMLWGLIGIVVMLGVFMLLKLIVSTFNLRDIDIQSNNDGGELRVDFPDYNPNP